MATSKTLTPTNVTIQIPEFTDQPDQRVNSNCIDKEADAINALNTAVTNKIKKRTISVTTNASGLYVSDVNFDTFVSASVSQTSNYLLITRKSSSSKVVFVAYDENLNKLASTTISVDIAEYTP